MSSCGLLYFLSLQKKASLMMNEQKTIEECHLIIFIAMLSLFVLIIFITAVFGFPLCPWAIFSWVLDHTSSARDGFQIVQWIYSQIRYSLVTPTNFVPPLNLNTLQKTTIDQRMWLG